MLHSHVSNENVRLAGFAAALTVTTSSGSSTRGMAALILGLLLVKPAFGIVFLLFFVPAGEDTTEIFRVFEVLTENKRSVRIVLYVLIEPFVIRKYVIDQCSEEDNVA